MVSSRGRYALRVMADLAENEKNGAFIPLKEIAEREELSLKYLESIMTTLSKAGLVEGAHGKGGGYRLKRKPEEYRVSEILKLTEGSLAPVSCVEGGCEPCENAGSCRTRAMWTKLDKLINDFFDGITIAELMSNPHCRMRLALVFYRLRKSFLYLTPKNSASSCISLSFIVFILGMCAVSMYICAAFSTVSIRPKVSSIVLPAP